jgi:hypothetical protein
LSDIIERLTPVPSRFKGVALGRSRSDIGIILGQIMGLIESNMAPLIEIENDWDCIGLFKEFGTTLMR